MVTKNNSQDSGLWLQPMAVIQGVVLAFFLLIIISIVLAFLVYFSSWQATPRLLNVLAHLSVFAGALLAGRRCNQKAWVHGIVVGILAFIILSIMGYGESLFVTWLWWKRLFRMSFISMLGGIVGGLFKS